MLWMVPPGTTTTGGITSVRKGSFLCLNDGGTFLQRGARPPLFHPFLLLEKPLVLSITMEPPPLDIVPLQFYTSHYSTAQFLFQQGSPSSLLEAMVTS